VTPADDWRVNHRLTATELGFDDIDGSWIPWRSLRGVAANFGKVAQGGHSSNQESTPRAGKRDLNDAEYEAIAAGLRVGAWRDFSKDKLDPIRGEELLAGRGPRNSRTQRARLKEEKHGTLYMYKLGCRCPACKQGRAKYVRDWRARKNRDV
jgi:hypothetical protein